MIDMFSFNTVYYLSPSPHLVKIGVCFQGRKPTDPRGECSVTSFSEMIALWMNYPHRICYYANLALIFPSVLVYLRCYLYLHLPSPIWYPSNMLGFHSQSMVPSHSQDCQTGESWTKIQTWCQIYFRNFLIPENKS